MPGHVKLGKAGEPDPDPAPYLIISMEMKREDAMKPYDPKKSYWVPNGKGGYMEGMLENDDGKKAIVMCGHEKKTFKTEEVGQVNPPKFEKCEDMANLTFLNDASVFYNLKVRFQANLIYTYSGLFCIVVNPYKRFPIYTQTVVKMYLGKRRNEVPPHLWAITETAYRNMLTNGKNQSMLITGESGAGKTENTKKVISYLAMVASSGKKSTAAKKVSLEDQIVATNPILESYGNAKTSRNDNSSRFGKFIRIHFTTSGKLCGCDIESYLLEKSRITQQQEVERSYHIFYQLLQPFVPDMKQKCLLGDDIHDYSYVSQGKVTVASIDDNEELEYTDSAFDIIGFTNEEKWDCFKLTAAVMSCGEIKFKQKGRDDQAEPDEMDYPKKVAELFGCDANELMKSFCKPKIKVGTEWVTKGQTCEQATNGVGGIARANFDRIFKWLIIKCNDTLIDKSMKKSNFTAVLDIAGFEIFEYNGFEQISINFVNEKLQQFFNHHMFVVEQEEYVAEGIDWAMVDFGMDLAACIIMFEKPMGIWAILEEESLFPKATDKSFEDKLKAQHLGKSPPMAKPQSKTDKNAHFAIIHYAGIVSYNVTAWLEKNKDPVNDTVVDVMKRGSNALLVQLWKDNPGQSAPPEEEKGKKKKKGGGAKTVSSVYLVQLAELMGTLHSTEPHFIRCIVPNTHKQPGAVEPELIMHQLTCNGVLEGIRICMRGFPNRMMYLDFKSRYAILGASEIASSEDNKTGVYALMDKIDFSREKYRLGHTKVFFRAGALAALEEARDDIVLRLVRWMQGECFRHIKMGVYQNKFDQRELMKIIQRNFRKFAALRNWGWFIIIQKTRPMIGQINLEDELRLLEEKANEAYGAYQEALDVTRSLEEANMALEQDRKALQKQLEAEQGNLSEYQERQAKAAAKKADLEKQLEATQTELSSHEAMRQDLNSERKILDGEVTLVKKDIKGLENKFQKVEQEKTNRDHTLKTLSDEVSRQNELLNKLDRANRSIENQQSKFLEELTSAGEKVEHLQSTKSKLESTLNEVDGNVTIEKKARQEADKQRRKLDGELIMSQTLVTEFQRGKRDLEGLCSAKEKSLSQLQSKLVDEQSLNCKIQNTLREYQGRVEEAEEALVNEKKSRAKAERQRMDLAKEYERVRDRLDDASDVTHAQMELNIKSANEVGRVRKDLEEARIQHDSVLINLKKRNQDALLDTTEQINQQTKMKSKIEKEKAKIQAECNDARSALDEMNRAKLSSEKSNRNLTGHLNELSKKIEEARLTLGDFESTKRRIVADNSDLLKVYCDIDQNLTMQQKLKLGLISDLEEAKNVADNEARERQNLMGKFKNSEHELEGLKEHLDEETTVCEDIYCQTKKAESEAALWKNKYESDGVAKSEELEMTNLKLQARVTEADNFIENMNAKLDQLEKARAKMQGEVEEINMNLEQAVMLNTAMEKKARQFDKIVREWQRKVESQRKDLDASQKECRFASSEVFKIKSAYEESVAQLEDVRKENKCLTDEIRHIMEQVNEGGKSINEIDKIRRRLEAEKLELTAALEEAEGALEQEENKVLRAQLENAQLKQDMEVKMSERDEENGNVRKNMLTAKEGMTSALEQENGARAEALRINKKLETDISELEIALEHANANTLESQKAMKTYQNQIREAATKLEEEQRACGAERDSLASAQKKANAMQNALEETKGQLEQADRSRRHLEQELADVNQKISEVSVQTENTTSLKRKLEAEMQTLNVSFQR